MALNYSVALRANPMDKDAAHKAYAKAQTNGELSLKQLSKRVASQPTVNRADVVAVMDGLDALLATVQMPSGIPVATVALNGAKNAAWLAAEILALGDEALAAKLEAERTAMAAQIAAKEEKLQKEIEEL